MQYCFVIMPFRPELVEPSGAASAAVVLFHKLATGVGRAGVVLSGGNVDFDVLREL
jgi:threonine dehydratase